MVLQNKYKARASKRYNAARGGTSDGRGRGSAGRTRGGWGRAESGGGENFPALHAGQDSGEDNGEGSSKGDDRDDSDEEGEDASVGSGGEARNKYSRRKLESNAWRYREEQVDLQEEADAEPEPPVDLSRLLERVAKLDSSRTSRALTSQEAAESSLQADSDDVDKSLLHLLERLQQRESAGGGSGSKEGKGRQPELSAAQLKQLEWEGKRLLEEKERETRHFGRVQKLKSGQPRTISLDIGDQRRSGNGDDPSLRLSGKSRRNIDITALYGDDDDDDEDNGGRTAASEDDGLDALLRQKGRANHAPHTTHTSAPISPGTAVTALPTSPSQRKEHEDFLDSII